MPFYDNFAKKKPTKMGQYITYQEARNVLAIILSQWKFNRKPSLLEIGPGRGVFARVCQENHISWTGADASFTLLNHLPQEMKKVQTFAPPLPFKEQAFDIVFASNLLEHMNSAQNALRLIQEMRRVVAPGGLVCQRVPNAMAWGVHFWNGDYTHNFFTTPRTVTQLYIDAEIQIEKLVKLSGPITGRYAKIAHLLATLIPAGDGAGPQLRQRLYSLKTTFLEGFLIIGRRSR